MNIASRVLLVEAGQPTTAGCRGRLESSPHRVTAVTSIVAARQALGNSPVDIVLLDMQLPDGSGLDFVDELLARESAPDIVVISEPASADMAVEAVRRGAVDFITRPVDAARLLLTLDNTAARQLLRRDNARLSRQQAATRDLVEPLWLVEKRAIQAAIAACDGNVNRAAGLLEVAPSTIYRKLQAWKKAGAGC
ncbi:DNA-binding response regulator [Pseudohaliea sp.]|uniref:DNA-binding response regulator n=1 Tax=Pseudohaliea sp. TaxID=2740289 RepID=UPI0032EE3E72